MPKYLFQGSYTVEGLRGVLREGGTKRREAVEQLVKGLGGRLETLGPFPFKKPSPTAGVK